MDVCTFILSIGKNKETQPDVPQTFDSIIFLIYSTLIPPSQSEKTRRRLLLTLINAVLFASHTSGSISAEENVLTPLSGSALPSCVYKLTHLIRAETVSAATLFQSIC